MKIDFELYDSYEAQAWLAQHVAADDRLTDLLWYLWHHQYSGLTPITAVPHLDAAERQRCLGIVNAHGLTDAIKVITLPRHSAVLADINDGVNTVITTPTRTYAVVGREWAARFLRCAYVLR